MGRGSAAVVAARPNLVHAVAMPDAAHVTIPRRRSSPCVSVGTLPWGGGVGSQTSEAEYSLALWSWRDGGVTSTC